MSVKRYLPLVLLGVCLGSGVAIVHQTSLVAGPHGGDGKVTREIASAKLKNFPRHAGKMSAPLSVQIQQIPESRPEKGYYKVQGHIAFNQPIGNFKYQWVLPPGAEISGDPTEGQVTMVGGEDEWQTQVEIVLKDNGGADQQIMFDVSYTRDGVPMGASDILVYRPMDLSASLGFGL